ncbi:hypothetical protein D3C81_176580 [compost metagenome]
MPRFEKDSIYFSLNGKEEDVRLDRYPRNAPLDLDLIIHAILVTNTEDETSDLEHVYFRAHQKQEDGSWKEMRGNDFSYPFQRAMQPLLEQAGRDTSGPMPCEMYSESKYVHIPLHHPRLLNANLFKG